MQHNLATVQFVALWDQWAWQTLLTANWSSTASLGHSVLVPGLLPELETGGIRCGKIGLVGTLQKKTKKKHPNLLKPSLEKRTTKGSKFE